ncbi:MAG: hypothetical protein KA143_11590 [Saprospiraceae bacterium]|nr:hypothetical protein [Saprospiraceae bacterium]
MFLNKVADQVFNIGLSGNESLPVAFRIRVINKVCSIIFVSSCVLLADRLTHQGEDLVLLCIPPVVTLGPMWCNYINKFNWSYHLVNFLYPFFCFIYYMLYGPDMGIDFVYFTALVALILYQEKRLMAINVSIVIGLFLYAFLYTRLHPAPFAHLAKTSDALTLLVASVLIIAVCILELLRMLKAQHKSIMEKNSVLEAQNNSMQKLIEKNNFNNNLLSVLAHDIHAPATAFNQLSQKVNYLIRRKDEHQLLKLADYFQSTGESLFNELNNLLDWVKIQKDKIQLKPEKIVINTVIHDLKLHFDQFESFRQTPIKMVNDRIQEVYTDQTVLKIVLRNLIQNGIKYGYPGTSLLIDFRETHGTLCISIQDTGPGIDDQIIQAINNQNEISKNLVSGHGLGLGISIALLKMIQGKIRVQNYINGAIITVLIPVILDHQAETNSNQSTWSRNNQVTH